MQAKRIVPKGIGRDVTICSSCMRIGAWHYPVSDFRPIALHLHLCRLHFTNPSSLPNPVPICLLLLVHSLHSILLDAALPSLRPFVALYAARLVQEQSGAPVTLLELP